MKEHTHGGDIYSLEQEIRLDYSANLNPLGMPAEIRQALCDHVDDYKRYPDSQCRLLRQNLSRWEQVPAEWILCGNGAADLLLRICQARNPKKTLIPAPTFSEYEKAARLAGSEIVYYALKRENRFAVTEAILEQLDETVDLCFLCNPNNPTGQLTDGELLYRIVKHCAAHSITLVVDECFLEFTCGTSCKPWLEEYPNLIIVKAFTKMFAIAGLRMGYLLTANAAMRSAIEDCGQSWAVSAPAQVAGISACGLQEFALHTRDIVAEERRWLQEQLDGLGLQVIPGQGNYLCFRSEKPLWKPMIEKGILIRSCDNYNGLDALDYRICVKLRRDNEQLIQALQEVLTRG